MASLRNLWTYDNKDNPWGPKTILVIPEYGKFVWWPVFEQVDIIPKGKRRPVKTITISRTKDNTREGAIRAVARTIIKEGL